MQGGLNIAFAQKEKKNTQKRWRGPTLSASQIIKNGMEQAWQLGQHLFALQVALGF